MIPRVKTWRATFWAGERKLASVEINAPNKVLARLHLNDAAYLAGFAVWQAFWDSDRVTWSVKREGSHA